MQISDLVFVGIKGSVVALHRTTGQQQWATHLEGSRFVNIMVQNDLLLASCSGEIFCLNPLTGGAVWHNPMKGFGLGLATLATVNSGESANASVLAEKQRRDQQDSSANTSTMTVL